MPLTDELKALADHVQVLPRRIIMDTASVRATVPMIRGTWGAALHGLDRPAYEGVFQGAASAGARVPGYLLRPAPADPVEAPAVEWILFGDAVCYDDTLLRAWDIASGMGLGRERSRFHTLRIRPLRSDGAALAPDRLPHRWSLGHAQWPIDGAAETSPCRLRFIAPLRMLRRGKLISSPTLSDIVVGTLRRLEAYAPAAVVQALKDLRPAALDLAAHTPATPWVGQRLDFERYSASQRAELDLRGFVGSLDLPEGPGEVWPLLAAALWLHIGKATVMGLGQLVVEPRP